MKPGDNCEIAFWLSGTETEEQLKKWKEVDAPDIIKNTEYTMSVEIGPLSFEIKKPGEDRVPPVPKNISGPDVRLIVATAKVLRCVKKSITARGFVNDLDPKDLLKLRAITRRAARGNGRNLNNNQCDSIIESLGVESALRTLRAVH